MVFVIAGQFTCEKEIREQEFYYETKALLILVGNRLGQSGQSPSRKYQSSRKCEALISFSWVFFVFVSTSIGTKMGRIFIRGLRGGQLPQMPRHVKGAPHSTDVRGGSCPKCPPWIRHCCRVMCSNMCEFEA